MRARSQISISAASSAMNAIHFFLCTNCHFHAPTKYTQPVQGKKARGRLTCWPSSCSDVIITQNMEGQNVNMLRCQNGRLLPEQQQPRLNDDQKVLLLTPKALEIFNTTIWYHLHVECLVYLQHTRKEGLLFMFHRCIQIVKQLSFACTIEIDAGLLNEERSAPPHLLHTLNGVSVD